MKGQFITGVDKDGNESRPWPVPEFYQDTAKSDAMLTHMKDGLHNVTLWQVVPDGARVAVAVLGEKS